MGVSRICEIRFVTESYRPISFRRNHRFRENNAFVETFSLNRSGFCLIAIAVPHYRGQLQRGLLPADNAGRKWRITRARSPRIMRTELRERRHFARKIHRRVRVLTATYYFTGAA